MHSKAAIRKEVLRTRKTLDPETLTTHSGCIVQKAKALSAFRQARCVLIYLSIRGEVETDGLVQAALDAGKTVCVPVIDPRSGELKLSRLPGLDIEFEEGPFDIREPASRFLQWMPPEEVDLVIMPGLAFDREGGRIGYGKGYFDRLLDRLNPDAFRVGLAFDFQIYDSLPQGPSDRRVHSIITETQVIDC